MLPCNRKIFLSISDPYYRLSWHTSSYSYESESTACSQLASGRIAFPAIYILLPKCVSPAMIPNVAQFVDAGRDRKPRTDIKRENAYIHRDGHRS